MLSLLIATQAAWACPTIATGTPSSLSFDVAQVAIVRQGTRTTFSVSINPSGDAQDFALVLPVPEVLEEHEVETLDPQIFARLDGYTAPRHVSDAGCPTSDTGYGDGGSAGGGDTGSSESDGSVDVEAEYLVGEYLVVILSAEESSSLATWLDDNDYHLPAGADERLQEYIDAGSYFLAAKVSDDAAVASGEPLSPLKLSYDNPVFSIPIRLATLNSPGEQDMVIYAITDRDGGAIGISNYTEFEVPDKCIWGRADEQFSVFYASAFTEAWTALADAGWTEEFEGEPGSANPVSSIALDVGDLAALGFDGDPEAHYLTRIRMRYTPEQATQDLSLYTSGILDPEVTAYADDNSQNRKCVEICGEEGGGGDGGGVGDGGVGDGGVGDGGVGDGGSVDDDDDESKGCSTAPGAAALLLGLVPLAALRRRRR